MSAAGEYDARALLPHDRGLKAAERTALMMRSNIHI
jgi:hypothetical protein